MNRPEIFDSVREAFDRGRWVMLTASDGAPQEITLDLKERPDDLLGAERTFDLPEGMTFTPAHDDHGPAIPAQDSRPLGELLREAIEGEPEDGWRTFTLGPVVYEFALQDAIGKGDLGDHRPKTLADASVMHAPDFYAAMAADWVHIYDRVTRERRTLKRPPADAVLTGLADVAADLRGEDWPSDGLASRTMADPAVVTEFPPDARGGMAPASPPYNIFTGISGEVLANGMDPELPAQPAPGPLTSTDGLLAGDVLRVVDPYSELASGLCRYNGAKDGSGGRYECIGVGAGRGAQHMVHRFAFVGRPDADGWMDWPGGENPVGEAQVVIRRRGGHIQGPMKATGSDCWNHPSYDPDINIVRFRLVDMPALTGDA